MSAMQKIINKPLEGGCQCGRIRYRSDVHFDNSHICHCRMCQKAVGNIFAALVATPADRLHWLKEKPETFASSDIAVRGFCKACGTPLFYEEIGANRINMTIGSLDNPNNFTPKSQIGIESKVSWCDALPQLPSGGTTEETMPAHKVGQIKATNAQYRE